MEIKPVEKKFEEEEFSIVYAQNIVYTCSVGTPLNLRYMCNVFMSWGPQYNPKKFSAVVIRVKYINTVAVLIFETGELVCTGSKSKEQATIVIDKIFEKIRSSGYEKYATFSNILERNLVASSNINFNVNLDAMYEENTEFCMYDHEEFPGLIMKHQSLGNITILIFDTGNIVITGSKILEDAQQACKIIFPLLKKYKIDNRGGSRTTNGNSTTLSYKKSFNLKKYSGNQTFKPPKKGKDCLTIGEMELHQIINKTLQMNSMMIKSKKRKLNHNQTMEENNDDDNDDDIISKKPLSKIHVEEEIYEDLDMPDFKK